MIIKTAVLGVSGYTGQELVRLLVKHPNFNLTNLFSTSFNGEYANIAPQFFGVNCPSVRRFDASLCDDLDIIFLAVPHTKAMPLVKQIQSANSNIKIVDLSADFRLSDQSVYESYYKVKHSEPDLLSEFVYGLPEKYKEKIASSSLCANPGCYATSIILGALPLEGLIENNSPISIDAKSGMTGAGKQLKEASLFCEVDGYISAYATGTHRHMAEFNQEVGFSNALFSPHLIPTMRGIESVIYIYEPKISELELVNAYQTYYNNQPFVKVLEPNTVPSTRLVNNNNNCALIPQKKGDWVVIFSLLDNLVKGAAGQAIQNANIMFGLEETLGLV